MEYKELEAVNKEIKTTDVKGKDYAEVPQRIKAFRKLFPNGSITTNLISNQDGVCIFKAIVTNEEGIVLATGTAYEKENSNFINKTSYIENCETSAVGRALGMLGIGIDVSIASAEEVTNAINNQDKKDSNKNKQEKRMTKTQYNKITEIIKTEEGLKLYKEVMKKHNVHSQSEITEDIAKEVIEGVKNEG